MPSLSRITPDEMQQLRRRKTNEPRTDLLAPYIDFLKGLGTNEGGRVELEDADSQRATKRRLTVAGKQIGKRVKYRTSPDRTLVFELLDAEAA